MFALDSWSRVWSVARSGVNSKIAVSQRWPAAEQRLLRYAHHGRSLAVLGCEENLDYCARIDSVNVVPLQVEPGVLKAAALD